MRTNGIELKAMINGGLAALPKESVELYQNLVADMEPQILELDRLKSAIADDDTQTVQEILSRISLVQYGRPQLPFLVTFLNAKGKIALPQMWNLDCRNTTNPYIIQSLLCSGYPIYFLEQQLRGNVRATNILLKMLPGISREAADKLEAALGGHYMRDIDARDAVSYDTTTSPIIYQGVTYDFASIVKAFATQTKNKKPLQLGHSKGNELQLDQMYLNFKTLEILQAQAVKFNIDICKPVPQSTYEVWLTYKNSYWQDYQTMKDLRTRADNRIMAVTFVLIFIANLSQLNDKYEMLSPKLTLLVHSEFFKSYEYVMARKQLLSLQGALFGVLNFARLAISYNFFQPMFNQFYNNYRSDTAPIISFGIMMMFFLEMISLFDKAYTKIMSPRLNFMANFADIKRDLTFDYATAKRDIPQVIAERFADEFAEERKPASLMFWQQVFKQRATMGAKQEQEQSSGAGLPAFRY